MIDDATIFQGFVEEAQEYLTDIKAGLNALAESQPDTWDHATLEKVFRNIRAIKGGAGFHGLKNIKKLASAQEVVLAGMRSKQIIIDKPSIATLLTALEKLEALVNDIVNSDTGNVTAALQPLKKMAPASKENFSFTKVYSRPEPTGKERGFIVAEAENGTRFAFPLIDIVRAESVTEDNFTENDGQKFLDTNNGKLLVLSLEECLGQNSTNPGKYALIYDYQGREVGIMINNITDVISWAGKISTPSKNIPGSTGVANMLDNKTTMLDANAILDIAMQEAVHSN